jgi:hypothetical protein
MFLAVSRLLRQSPYPGLAASQLCHTDTLCLEDDGRGSFEICLDTGIFPAKGLKWCQVDGGAP